MFAGEHHKVSRRALVPECNPRAAVSSVSSEKWETVGFFSPPFFFTPLKDTPARCDCPLKFANDILFSGSVAAVALRSFLIHASYSLTSAVSPVFSQRRWKRSLGSIQDGQTLAKGAAVLPSLGFQRFAEAECQRAVSIYTSPRSPYRRDLRTGSFSCIPHRALLRREIILSLSKKKKGKSEKNSRARPGSAE